VIKSRRMISARQAKHTGRANVFILRVREPQRRKGKWETYTYLDGSIKLLNGS